MLRSHRLPFALALALAGLLVTGWVAAVAAASGSTVPVDIKYSRFEPDELRFEAGQEVTFVIFNDDPIDHEFILGDQAVQDRHEAGSESHDGSIPTEVTVPAGATVETTITFYRSGDLILGCHLPGHYAYGMKAAVSVG
ncbi:hypothetical protein BH23ACT12_BH23ACT12_03920 [soil metagenome]